MPGVCMLLEFRCQQLYNESIVKLQQEPQLITLRSVNKMDACAAFDKYSYSLCVEVALAHPSGKCYVVSLRMWLTIHITT